MKKIVIAICDADQAYGEKFVTWISLEGQDRFLGCCFSEEESFLEYLKRQQPDIVLLGKGFLGSSRILEQIERGQGEACQAQGAILWMCLYDQAESSGMPERSGIAEQSGIAGQAGISEPPSMSGQAGISEPPSMSGQAGISEPPSISDQAALSEVARGLPVLDKYQPVSKMIRDILSCYQCYGKREEMASFRQELIGIYSPGHSIWQTPFALTMAQVLGQRERVLYVSLKECAGFSRWFQEEYQRDLLDVMYLCLTGNGNVADCVGSAVYRMGDFSYIPPAADSICLGEVLKQDYLKFVKLLAGQSGYDLVILDFGMMVSGFFELLAECSRVYILTEPGELQEAPLQHFCQMVDKQAQPVLQEKIDYLTLPELQPVFYQRGQWLQQWMWGSLGDYVRKLMGVQSGTD